ADGHEKVVPFDRAVRELLADRPENDLAVPLRRDEAAVPQAVGEDAVLVAEADVVALLHPVVLRDGCTHEGTTTVGDLDGGVLLRGCETRRRLLGVDRPELEAQLPAVERDPRPHEPHAEHLERRELLAAGGILVVDEPVAVVVDAVTADLDPVPG